VHRRIFLRDQEEHCRIPTRIDAIIVSACRTWEIDGITSEDSRVVPKWLSRLLRSKKRRDR